LKAEGKTPKEINDELKKLQENYKDQKNYREQLKSILYKKDNINRKEDMNRALEKEWESLKERFQCFIICFKEDSKDGDSKIVEFIKTLYESSFSKIKNQ